MNSEPAKPLQPYVADKKILVTQPFLPPLEEAQEFLQDIWDSKWLTNQGRYHQALEKELASFLGVPYVALFANGTLALFTALQAMRVTGEVITTPFSFVATTHALWWNNIRPVFVDIEPEHCNLDPEKVESAITPKTTGILPVHVYGHPCQVERLQEIADIYGLHLIYDAAHAFGVKYKDQSVLNYGDLSILSFHATKVFNTFEGGAIICHDAKTKKRIDYLKNFGFVGETTVIAPGINAKMNEFQAGIGLLQLKYFDQVVEQRKAITKRYQELLSDIEGISFIHQDPDVTYNHAYFPIFIDQEKCGRCRDDIYEKLKAHNYFGRRYFYPLISTFNAYKSLPSAEPENLPVATRKANQVICLPIYPGLEMEHVENIAALIREFKQ
ncbi:DegT/DnrJ/EryC1/StrS aminotransferase [Desulfonatronospira thiodismutans ASO3-1]|uniref:DegT/DnrJ/EryC1/StrS aminotransferase n=1 Tax=Desulfonatronospira thiodismutans ASO3-1 TaxID=555779 RepID=D6SU57_9BACT|nr:DegT/DnrJ/EryC1/StrS family aminotransferase [Desulfonatronospira thiodismutans]EFI32837.1 DegT/DnrJ/EryC1/StrS aminotransferase [Desulfonatronospira thiodismutans ASO3-1]